MQVSPVLQQYMVDDLLLVAIDRRHHDSNHKIVLEGKLFRDQRGKDPNFCWLPILAWWTQENRSVGILSIYLGNLAVPIWFLP